MSKLLKIKHNLTLIGNSISWIKDPNMIQIMRYLIPTLNDIVKEIEEIEKEMKEGEVDGRKNGDVSKSVE